MALIFIQHLLLQRTFSLRAFSYYAPFQTALIFITRILLQRLKNEEGAERKYNFEEIL
jgi:hypothetical protein